MKNLISLPQAAALALSDASISLVTTYQLGRLVFALYIKREYKGQRIDLRKASPERRHLLAAQKTLLANGALRPVKSLPQGSLYSLPGAPDPDAHQLLCAVDPFAYLSHMSAMAIHGLTDRIPHTIFASSPEPKAWRGFADAQMEKDLGARLEAYVEAGFPILLRARVEKIQGQAVHMTKSAHLGAFKRLDPQGVRVSTLGRTFLDMLRDADLCGGMLHVMDVYLQHAKTYLPLITAEVDQHATDIEKVRAGYILEERCGFESPAFEQWVKVAKRGGSRKLVPNQPYSSTYSEKWCLSLNI
jgi:hypothetical protein